MSQSIWTQCAGKSKTKRLDLTAWRVVESQSQNSTRKLVDSLEEQTLLEELIETAKPPMPTGPEWDHLHFLLSTPFRYPSLQHGSRFRSRIEPGVWYGSLDVVTALAETAYWRFRFLNDSHAEIALAMDFTAFNIRLKSERAIDLTIPPFSEHQNKISDKTTYRYSQILGSEMRGDGVQMFKFLSARVVEKRFNVGVFDPRAFAKKEPDQANYQTWNFYSTKSKIEFKLKNFFNSEVHEFQVKQFEVSGKLPVVGGN